MFPSVGEFGDSLVVAGRIEIDTNGAVFLVNDCSTSGACSAAGKSVSLEGISFRP